MYRLSIAGFLVVSCLFTCATVAEPLRVGISVWSGYEDSVEGFKQGIDSLGVNREIEYLLRNAGADSAAQYAIAREFAERKVDLVYSLTTPGTSIIKEVMPAGTPIVFSIVTYPADSGLIESMDYSGNNLVGTSNYVPLNNYVELLVKMLPEAKNAAIFHRKGEPNSKIQASNLIRLLQRRGIVTRDVQATSIGELVGMAKKLSGVDVFITTTDTLMQGGGEEALIKISLALKIPILSSNKNGIVAGSAFGPVADFRTLGRISGEMAARILKGEASPSSLSSEFQEPPSIIANRKSLERLGIEVPASIQISFVDE